MPSPRPKRTILDDLVDDEPELHHYTTFDGLRGMLKSNGIWATHFRHTNDSTEFILLHTLLVKTLTGLLTVFLKEVYSVNKSFRDLAHRTSGSFDDFVHDHALGIVDAAYDVDIGDPVDGSFAKTPEDGAFVTCFCSHNHDSDFIKSNGLLSQWRGYTGSSRFCIVFDTKDLVRLARREADEYLWRFVTIDRVNYVADELPSGEDFEAVTLWCMRKVVEQMAGDTFADHPFERSDAYRVLSRLGFPDTLLSCATKIKHQSFAEEREIRMVAFRAGPETIRKAISFGQPIRTAQHKPLRVRTSADLVIPYVSFFEELGERLPIKRIIVGPSRDQYQHYSRARDIVPSDIPISTSAIPLVK